MQSAEAAQSLSVILPEITDTANDRGIPAAVVVTAAD